MATIEEIHAAADTVEARGDKVTQARVRAELGGGSFTDINAAMKSWTGKKRATPKLREASPEGIREELDRFATQIWQTALDMANKRIQDELAAIELMREEMEREKAEIMTEADALAAELDATQGKNRELDARVQGLEKELKTAERERENARVAEQAAQARLETSAGMIDELKSDKKKLMEIVEKGYKAEPKKETRQKTKTEAPD